MANPSGAAGTAHRTRAEVERLRDEAVRQLNIADRRAHFWTVVDICLGFPAALLAGVSGTAALASADARVPAAVLALLSAGFSAGAGFLRSDSRRVANKRARQAWAAVEAKASTVLVQERVDCEALRALFDARQAALAAYEGGEF